MYTRKREFKRYTLGDILLVIGLSVTLFVVGGIFIGYGVYITEWMRIPHLLDLESFQRFYIVDFVFKILGPGLQNFMQSIYIVWFIGILCMVASFMGLASIIRWAIFKLQKRKR